MSATRALGCALIVLLLIPAARGQEPEDVAARVAACQRGQLAPEALEAELILRGPAVLPELEQLLPTRRAAGPLRLRLLRLLVAIDAPAGEAALLRLAAGPLAEPAYAALGETGSRAAWAPLLARASGEDAAQRPLAATALVELCARLGAREEAWPTVLGWVRESLAAGGLPPERDQALRLLARLGGWSAADQLVLCLDRDGLRLAALDAASQLARPAAGEAPAGWEEVLGALVRLADARPDLETRRRVVAALGHLSDLGAVPRVLALAAGDADPLLVKASCAALKELARRDLGEDLGAWRAYWTQAGPVWERYPALLAAVQGGGAAAREALAVIGLVRDERGLAAIRELLAAEPDDEALLIAACEALVQLGHSDAEPLLEALLSHPSPAVRERASWALGFYRPPGATQRSGPAGQEPGSEPKQVAPPPGWRLERVWSPPSAPAPLRVDAAPRAAPRAGEPQPTPAPSPELTPPPVRPSRWRLPEGKQWFLVVATTGGLAILVLVLPSPARQRHLLVLDPGQQQDTVEARREAQLERRMREREAVPALGPGLLDGFQAGLALLRGLEETEDLEPSVGYVRFDARPLADAPDGPALALGDEQDHDLSADLEALIEEQWAQTLAALRGLDGSLDWVGARLRSRPEELQTVYEGGGWASLPDALAGLEAIRPTIDEVRARLRPLSLSEAGGGAAVSGVLALVGGPEQEDEDSHHAMDVRRWQRLRGGLLRMGESLLQVRVRLLGVPEPVVLFHEGDSLAALEARLLELREVLRAVTIQVRGCQTELVLYDHTSDARELSAATSAGAAAPWVQARDPGADDWSRLLGSLRGLERQVLRLEITTTLARGATQVLFEKDVGVGFGAALAGLENLRSVLEEVRVQLEGSATPLVLFRRDEDDVVALLPASREDTSGRRRRLAASASARARAGAAAGAAVVAAPAEPAPVVAPAAGSSDPWLTALHALSMLEPVLLELAVQVGPEDAPRVVHRAGADLGDAVVELLEGPPPERLEALLVGASERVVLWSALAMGRRVAATGDAAARPAALAASAPTAWPPNGGGGADDDPTWAALTRALAAAELARATVEVELHGGLRQRLSGPEAPAAADALTALLADLRPGLEAVWLEAEGAAPRLLFPAPPAAGPADSSEDPEWEQLRLSLEDLAPLLQGLRVELRSGEQRAFSPAGAWEALVAARDEVERVAARLVGVPGEQELYARPAELLALPGAVGAEELALPGAVGEEHALPGALAPELEPLARVGWDELEASLLALAPRAVEAELRIPVGQREPVFASGQDLARAFITLSELEPILAAVRIDRGRGPELLWIAPPPVEAAPSARVEAAPVAVVPVAVVPVEVAPAEATPVASAPVASAPTPVEATPVEATPVEAAPVASAPAADAAPAEPATPVAGWEEELPALPAAAQQASVVLPEVPAEQWRRLDESLERLGGALVELSVDVATAAGDPERRVLCVEGGDLSAARRALTGLQGNLLRVNGRVRGSATELLLFERSAVQLAPGAAEPAPRSVADRLWSELLRSLGAIAAQLLSVEVSLEDERSLRYAPPADLQAFLDELERRRSAVQEVRARLARSSTELVLYSREHTSRSPARPAARAPRRAPDVARWTRILAALQRLRPLVERLELRLRDAAEDYRPLYVDGGDYESALRSLDATRERLEVVRVRFKELTLFLRSEPGTAVALVTPGS
ncbi:MAG: HEAT repeat domain-containing protein [Planctomycetota bacterium]